MAVRRIAQRKEELFEEELADEEVQEIPGVRTLLQALRSAEVCGVFYGDVASERQQKLYKQGYPILYDLLNRIQCVGSPLHSRISSALSFCLSLPSPC